MKSVIKTSLELIKKKGWYLVLLLSSSKYVWHYRYDIYQLKEINAQNLIFIVWLLLLLLPLFSEMEFLGVKVRKEVEKATEEVKGIIANLQAQVSQFQLTNSVANSISFNNSPLPTEQKIEELLQMVRNMQSTYAGPDTQTETSLIKTDDKTVYLFKVRLSIETSLYELCEKIGHTERMSIFQMMRRLLSAEILAPSTCDLISQVVKIANRGVHGEIVSKKYIDFVEDTYPEILRQLRDAFDQI